MESQEFFDKWGQKIVRVASLPVTLKNKDEIEKLKKGEKWLDVSKYKDILPEDEINKEEVGCDHDGRYILRRPLVETFPPHKKYKVNKNDFEQFKSIVDEIHKLNNHAESVKPQFQEYIFALTHLGKLHKEGNELQSKIMNTSGVGKIDYIDWEKGDIYDFDIPKEENKNG